MIHTKGYDSFTSTKYEEGATHLLQTLNDNGIDVTYMPAHEVQVRFPRSIEDLRIYDAIVISDIGANTFLLQNPTFYNMEKVPNSLELIKQFVSEGGGFLMIGGYLSFMGIEGKANYKNSPLAEILPVVMEDGDDRVEVPQGINPNVVSNHGLLKELGEWSSFLGYNKLTAKSNTDTLMEINEDPFLVLGSYHKGKTAAFASDCAPHWGSLEFVEWENYSVFWSELIKSLQKD
ncbi:glutamine amidotransferase [Gracilibacillus salinarum]|uniref:Glutamine amidotransferase n=2 Tax=Gracilibacillus salinarum TaxID=2932255 RepID=A0ABY4GTC0_9BACI|nr:glutamine amidotransferase [Gracilibacillus salinarum]